MKKVEAKISCPLCDKECFYGTSNPFRPFCSERCQIQDRAHWVSGDYRIACSNSEGIDEDAVSEVATSINSN